jgi:hypothetical protein
MATGIHVQTVFNTVLGEDAGETLIPREWNGLIGRTMMKLVWHAHAASESRTAASSLPILGVAIGSRDHVSAQD